MFDGKALGEQLTVVVRDFVTRATATLSMRIDELAAQIKAMPAGPRGEKGEKGEKGDPGPAGRDGSDGNPGRDGIDGAQGPKGDPGADGASGQNGINGERGEKGDTGAQGPAGADGKPGLDGRDGRDGHDGKSVSIEDVSLLVRAVVAEIPPPQNGRDGVDGKDGAAGRDGVDGKNGLDGAHGRDGEPGAKGDPGENGKDAAPVDYDRVRAIVAEVVSELPPAEKGDAGAAGKDAEVDYTKIIGFIDKAISIIPAPQNGKDADPEFIRAEISKAVANMPPARDGRDGKDAAPVDVDAVARIVLSQIPTPKDGENGRDGESADPAVIAQMVEAHVERAIAAIPKAKDGAPGADGKSLTAADIAPLVLAEVKKAVDSIPKPVDGRDGADGKNGESITLDQVIAVLQPHAEVVARQAALKAAADLPAPPPARDGRDGKDAAPVDVDAVIKTVLAQIPSPADGKDGRDGADGKSFTAEDVRQIIEAEQAKHALDFERRVADIAQRTIDDLRGKLERAIEAIPVPRDGRDALDLDDVDLTQSEDGRTVTLSFRRGSEVREKSFRIASIIDRGIWRHESKYEKGDAVTFSGSLWIAQKDSPGKPKDGDGWRLSVKNGAFRGEK